MKFDPKHTEKYRDSTKKDTMNMGSMKTKLCLSCKKLRSVGQFNAPESKFCNWCKRRV